MEINFKNENQKIENDKKLTKKVRRKMNPTTDIILKVLIICALIDVPIWAYFHFVKRISLWEGLIQMQYAIQNKNIHQQRKNIEFTNNEIQHNKTIEDEETKRRYLEAKLKAVKQETIAAEQIRILIEENEKNTVQPMAQTKQNEQKIYTWTNEHGHTVHSNRPKPE